MAKPSQAKPPPRPEGQDRSQQRSASIQGAVRSLSEDPQPGLPRTLSSDRDSDPQVPAAPTTDPDLVRDHEIMPAVANEADSAPPSIPSAASVTAEEAPRPQGSIPVLPGHVIANRYEVL